jgi:enoyl-CoA hydratase/carnithine racemase
VPDPTAHHIDVSPPDAHGVARLRFSTGRVLNAMTLPAVEDLLACASELQRRTDIRVLTIEGTDEAFSGGADLRSMEQLDESGYVHYINTEFELFHRIDVLPFITVAVISGPCLGNAAELVLGCDFRIAASTAVFGLAETRVGFQGPTQRLTQYVPIGVAKDLLFRGRILDAGEALALGLFNEVVDPVALPALGRSFAEELAQLPPVAVRITKRNIASAYEAMSSGTDQEIASSLECYRTTDFREGVAAFFAKRQPNFTGS